MSQISYIIKTTFLTITLFTLFSSLSWSQAGSTKKKTVSQLSEEIPHGMESKSRLDKGTLENKIEGGAFSGLPLVNSDADLGFGYGARVYYIHNGKKNNPFFKYSPYFHRIFAQFFQTTNGYLYHTVDYDAPYFNNSLFRLRGSIVWEKNTGMNYFGLGSASMGKLTMPTNTILGAQSGKTYDKAATYLENLRDLYGTSTWGRYNKFSYEKPRVNLSIEREIFGGVIRPFLGFSFGKVNIVDYSGVVMNTGAELKGNEATMQDSKLLEDQNLGSITGFNGGWENTIKLAVAYDTRDFEPDPRNGVYIEVLYDMSTKLLGSTFDYQIFAFTPAFFYSPIAKFQDLRFALRYHFSSKTGEVPFYAANYIDTISSVGNGLGGVRTLRGYTLQRFAGNVMSMLNFETRLNFYEVNAGSHHFAFMIVPFIDYGRTFDKPDKLSFDNYKLTYGAGLRIAWNQATIIMIDYGISEEGSGLYINFNHIF